MHTHIQACTHIHVHNQMRTMSSCYVFYFITRNVNAGWIKSAVCYRDIQYLHTLLLSNDNLARPILKPLIWQLSEKPEILTASLHFTPRISSSDRRRGSLDETVTRTKHGEEAQVPTHDAWSYCHWLKRMGGKILKCHVRLPARSYYLSGFTIFQNK